MGTAWPELDAPAFDLSVLTGSRPPYRIGVADPAEAEALRHAVFVVEQGLFDRTDRDAYDEDGRAVTLVARDAAGDVLGTVRLAPARPGEPEVGWWTGSRLAVRTDVRGHRLGVGSALIRAAGTHAVRRGALRFDAHVQEQNARLFERLGWRRWGGSPVPVGGRPHVAMTWPIDRLQRLVDRTKRPLSGLLAPLQATPWGLGGAGFRGDDGAPVPGSDLVAATDAILPSLVQRDPEWAGWCGVLVNVNDLAAMGATPVALLDAVAARDATAAARVLHGLQAAAHAWDVPVIGGHTQLGVPAALAVTALGATADPVPAGGGRPGDEVRVTADLTGGWRPGYAGAQWDSTSGRRSAELQALQGFVARSRPAAAKDVSMAGLVGTLGMLAEASGCGAELTVADVPRPDATVGEWFSCFPGFAMITTDRPGTDGPDPGPAVSAVCGVLTPGTGVALRWPDGRTTAAVTAGVTGLGRADQEDIG